MRVALTTLLAASLLPALAIANQCTEPLRYGPATGDTVRPIAGLANGIIDTDLAAASRATDPLLAIATLQRHLFDMAHPELPEEAPTTGFYRVRCADPDRYEQLNGAIGKLVQSNRKAYRNRAWFIGGGYGVLDPEAPNAQKPGLLNLLLMANLYEDFEQEARDFLTAAIGDAEADKHFDTLAQLAASRLRYLSRWDMDYRSDYAQGGVGLLPAERSGLRALQDIEDRLAPLRDLHVKHWLGKEDATFERILASAPNPAALINLQLGADTATATEQLRLARSVARSKDVARINQRAVARGDGLMKRERFTEAAEYYDFAGAKPQLARARAQEETRGEARIEKFTRGFEKQRDEMMKTADEREAFESDTDALADELGIDLDDF
jgi:hypothetical protein